MSNHLPTLHPVSVNLPYSNKRMWAVGLANKISVDTSADEYPAREVPMVVTALRRLMCGDAVITVY